MPCLLIIRFGEGTTFENVNSYKFPPFLFIIVGLVSTYIDAALAPAPIYLSDRLCLQHKYNAISKICECVE